MSTRRPPGALDLSLADEDFKDRFWSKVDQRGPDECWPWVRYCTPAGYGQFTLRKGVFITASRVAYALVNGAIPARFHVCHRCDNPPCCNPAHLFAGTARENAIDCVEKGRAKRSTGEDHRSHKLTAEDVARIRSTPIKYGTRTRLAREYGVAWHSIDKILKGLHWKEAA